MLFQLNYNMHFLEQPRERERNIVSQIVKLLSSAINIGHSKGLSRPGTYRVYFIVLNTNRLHSSPHKLRLYQIDVFFRISERMSCEESAIYFSNLSLQNE